MCCLAATGNGREFLFERDCTSSAKDRQGRSVPYGDVEEVWRDGVVGSDGTGRIGRFGQRLFGSFDRYGRGTFD